MPDLKVTSMTAAQVPASLRKYAQEHSSVPWSCTFSVIAFMTSMILCGVVSGEAGGEQLRQCPRFLCRHLNRVDDIAEEWYRGLFVSGNTLLHGFVQGLLAIQDLSDCELVIRAAVP